MGDTFTNMITYLDICIKLFYTNSANKLNPYSFKLILGDKYITTHKIRHKL